MVGKRAVLDFEVIRRFYSLVDRSRPIPCICRETKNSVAAKLLGRKRLSPVAGDGQAGFRGIFASALSYPFGRCKRKPGCEESAFYSLLIEEFTKWFSGGNHFLR
jgi:hypothetical protein